MNFNADIDVDIEDVFENMSSYDKKLMLKYLKEEDWELEAPIPFEGNNKNVVKERILKSVYENFGFGSPYLDELISGIQKIKQGEVLL